MLKFNRTKTILLIISTVFSVIFFFLSLSSLYIETDILNSGFHTPWFSWQVDAVAIYFLTAIICLVTARLSMSVFHKNGHDNCDCETLIEG